MYQMYHFLSFPGKALAFSGSTRRRPVAASIFLGCARAGEGV